MNRAETTMQRICRLLSFLLTQVNRRLYSMALKWLLTLSSINIIFRTALIVDRRKALFLPIISSRPTRPSIKRI